MESVRLSTEHPVAELAEHVVKLKPYFGQRNTCYLWSEEGLRVWFDKHVGRQADGSPLNSYGSVCDGKRRFFDDPLDVALEFFRVSGGKTPTLFRGTPPPKGK
jgi:hypothetical protein